MLLSVDWNGLSRDVSRSQPILKTRIRAPVIPANFLPCGSGFPSILGFPAIQVCRMVVDSLHTFVTRGSMRMAPAHRGASNPRSLNGFGVRPMISCFLQGTFPIHSMTPPFCRWVRSCFSLRILGSMLHGSARIQWIDTKTAALDFA